MGTFDVRPGSRARRGEALGLWGAITLVTIVAGLAYRSLGAADGTLGWVEHTDAVLRQLTDVSGAYARSVGARRAYVVAGDDSQLGERTRLDGNLATSLGTLRTLIADNAAQTSRLDTLESLLRRRVDEVEGEVEARRRGGPGGERPESLALVSDIRGAREAMEGEENRLLVERYGRTRLDLMQTKWELLAGTCVGVAVLVFVFRRLREEIGRRVASQLALQRANHFLDSIVENIPDMVFVKHASELRFERINRAGEALLGVGRADLLGKNDYDFFPREQADHFQALDRETLAGHTIVDIPEEPIDAAEGKRWLHTKKVPILDERGEPKYLLGISQDITERKLASEALRTAKDAADAANKELEAFSYSVAHDLRAPLRAIDGFSRALTEDCAAELGPEGLAHLERVRASTRHMSTLIDGLLGLSRLTRGELVRAEVDLARIAVESAARLREAQPDRRVDLVVATGLVAQGDAHLLTAAMDNLLGNAWKFTRGREDARVEVGKIDDGDESAFFVKDNGAGFDQAYANKLFGVFQRLHSVQEFEGTGLGLATVQRIVRRHGGRIWAVGEVGRGATFYFTL